MKQITIAEAIQRTVEHREVFHDEMLHIMRQIMRGELSPAQIAGFIMGLRVKKETIGEIAAAAQVMRELATPVEVGDERHLVDTCGTGGDSAHTFNVSTCAAFVAAAGGARVAKHMGRSVSSSSGSAEVLEALGAHIALTPEQTGQAIDRLGLGFMFAPAHHSAMKHAAPVRKDLGVRTLFNILGELVNGEINEYTLHPSQFGLELYDRRAITVHTVDESREMILAVLGNQPGPAHNIVALNAGAAIYVSGVAKTLKEGVERARAVIASGAARKKLDELVAFTKKL